LVSNLVMLRTNLLRLCLCLLGCFVAAYQVRYSREVLHVKQSYDYVPFRLLPFGNRIGTHAYSTKATSLAGAELVAVNGRPFTGLTIYLQELRRANTVSQPFKVTVRGNDGVVCDHEINFPHCTCGVPRSSMVILVDILPPAFCVLLGLTVAGLWMTRPLPWLFLALMLCLSQYTLIPDLRVRFGGFQQMVEVGGWHDWFRIPAVGYESICRSSWPVWLVLFTVHFFLGLRTRRHLIYVRLLSIAMLALGVAWTIAAVGWSENFSKVAPLSRWLIHTSDWQTIACTCAAVICVSHLGKRWVAAMVVLIACAMTLLYWRELGLPTYTLVSGADSRLHLAQVVPESFLARAFVVATFGCAAFAVYTLAHFRILTRVEKTSFLILGSVAPMFCVGQAPYPIALSWGYWYPVFFPLAIAGLGLLGVAWSVKRRSTRNDQSPGIPPIHLHERLEG
jgi:hypothetical protein